MPPQVTTDHWLLLPLLPMSFLFPDMEATVAACESPDMEAHIVQHLPEGLPLMGRGTLAGAQVVHKIHDDNES